MIAWKTLKSPKKRVATDDLSPTRFALRARDKEVCIVCCHKLSLLIIIIIIFAYIYMQNQQPPHKIQTFKDGFKQLIMVENHCEDTL